MADHDVDIGDDGTVPPGNPNKKIKTLPGKVQQAQGQASGKTIELRVKKHTRAVLYFPNADKLFTGAPKDLLAIFPPNGRIQYTFVANPPKGAYPYAVFWEDGTTKQFAEGSSPPEVIIY